jgi:hypothetical protein
LSDIEAFMTCVNSSPFEAQVAIYCRGEKNILNNI